MNEPASANLIWENNPDTAINASNLSKVIDYQSDSKFILLSDSEYDIQAWADHTELSEAEIRSLNPINYLGKIVATEDGAHAITGVLQSGGEGADWVDIIAPKNRLLTIAPKTKIALEYTSITDNKTKYVSFDTETKSNYFYVDHLIDETQYYINSIYFVYLYYHISYNGYAEVRIVKSDNNGLWKIGGVDGSSPTGTKVISTRKIGGFETNSLGEIIEDTIWDLSTYKKEIVVEKYKTYENSKVRAISAKDIKIEDKNNYFSSSTDEIETALSETKAKVDQVYKDTYAGGRFGVELKYSFIREDLSLPDKLQEMIYDSNAVKLKMTKGFIDIAGQRRYFDDDIYFTSTSGLKFNINGNEDIYPLTLGTSTNNDKLDDGIWRVYISQLGRILLKKGVQPTFIYSSTMKGWYDISDSSRCIGKFRVARTSPTANTYYVEKQSVTNTFESIIPINTIYTYHGTMCPDGLLPCDGRWHDINGISDQSFPAAPLIDQWRSGSWYEETPNLLGRTTKMLDTISLNGEAEQTLDFAFIDASNNRIPITGGSHQVGEEGGSELHTHEYDHKHNSGSLSIEASGAHLHEPNEVTFMGNVTDIVKVEFGSQNFEVPSVAHEHVFSVGGSEHDHQSEYFAGETATLSESGTNINTEESSTWSPYKEILYCIKK